MRNFGIWFFLVFFTASLFAEGLDGLPITINADGSAQSFDNSGRRGYDGRNGSNGHSASCQSVGGPHNVYQPSGGDGQDGGDGGNGGDGGDITVYYQDLVNLRSIYLRNTPGRGGSGGYGGYGGSGCDCGTHMWTITDADGKSHTYTCSDGRDGSRGSAGSPGRSGNYGRIFLIKGATPVQPAMPSVYIDMAKMETGPILLSQNSWQQTRGARGLFRAGSDISDYYYDFQGRTEVEYAFKWEADRPLSRFAGWNMLVQLVGSDVKVTLPNQLIAQTELVVEGNRRTLVFKGVMQPAEVANLSLGALTGNKSTTSLRINDASQVSQKVSTKIQLKLQTLEKNTYKVRFEGEVPATAVNLTANGIDLLIGKLGIADEFLVGGTRAYVGLTVTRGFAQKAWTLKLGNYYTLPKFIPGVLIEILSDSNLLTGTKVVGKVLKGEKYKVLQTQGEWISLEKLDGTALPGWIQASKIKLSEAI